MQDKIKQSFALFFVAGLAVFYIAHAVGELEQLYSVLCIYPVYE